MRENIRVSYTVHVLELEKCFNAALNEERYTVDTEAAPASWCFDMLVRTKSAKWRVVQ